MAVKRRLKGYSGMRVDWPHIRSLESAVSFDIDSVLRGLVTGLNKPYLIRGFKVQIPDASIPASSLQIEVADSAILHSSASESGTILTIPAGTPNEVLDNSNAKVIGAFVNGVPNYIAVDYRRVTDPTTADQTAGWSPSQDIEFQRSVPIGNILEYRFVITTNGFGSNLPLYLVNVSNTGSVESITKGVNSLFRLGTGGAVPDPFFTFDYGGLLNDQTSTPSRREWISDDGSLNPTSVVPSDPAVAFDYGDWSITSLKEWMDAMMSRFKELSGSSFWYVHNAFPGNEPNLFDVWWDTAGSVMTGNGNLSYNLVLESTNITEGAYQSVLTDSDIVPGDSYVIGLDSLNRATLQSVTGNQLIINSLIKEGFIYDEILQNRRIFNLNSAVYEIEDQKNGQSDTSGFVNRTYGLVKRIESAASGSPNVITWGYESRETFAEIIIQTTSSHGLSPQDTVSLADFSAGSNAPNGQFIVSKIVSADTFIIETGRIPTGVPDAATAVVDPGSDIRLPYIPKFGITESINAGSLVTVTAPGHHFLNPQTETGDFTSGSNKVDNVTNISNLKIGMLVENANVPSETEIIKIDITGNSVYLSQNATATAATESITFSEQIIVEGMEGSSDVPLGRYTVISVTGDDIIFDAGTTPSGLITTPASATIASLRHSFLLSVEGADQTEFNLVDSDAVALNDMQIYYDIGPDTLPSIGVATGNIFLDGVVAISTVANPARITAISIANAGQPIVVDTIAPHGLASLPSVDYTIFGDSTVTPFVRAYDNIEINVISTTQFEIINHDFTADSYPFTYTNVGNIEAVFARSPDNPFPGPIQWDSDLILKGIIGDKSFTIPQSATAEGTPTANRFNNDGLTGTAYLLDGEVAYVILERNESVSGGAFYSVNDGKTMVGSIPPLDKDGANLSVGDFVKFEDESETKWLKIDTLAGGEPGDPIISSSFKLIADNGQSPTIEQRNTNNGKLVYCKGRYDVVTVKKHYEVDSNPDIYWIAVRRDNLSLKSKVYLKSLELEPGETRSINDNEPNNHLAYTGAGTEAAVNPNYTEIDQSGSYTSTQSVEVESIDSLTREVSFADGPDLGFQVGDQIEQGGNTYEIKDILTSRTVVIDEEVATLTSGAATFKRLNSVIRDTDNLTLAIRKDDREIGTINTALARPVYDESFYVQKMELTDTASGTGYVASGDYIYIGPQDNPTALAWVLHGTQPTVETIEGSSIGMPGGHASVGSTGILIVIISGSFADNDLLQQNGVYTGFDLDNPGDPALPSPPISGGTSNDGVELALPPNKRTQVVGGSGYVVWPAHATYKSSLDLNLTGEELLIIANDTIRQAGVDYYETFGGPKGTIKLVRDLPENTRIRARTMTSFGSAVAKAASSVDLQRAYDNGNIISTTIGRPVDIQGTPTASGDPSLFVTGSIAIDSQFGALNPTGGLIGHNFATKLREDGVFNIGADPGKPKDVWSQNFKTKTHGSHPGSEKVAFTAGAQTSNASPTSLNGTVIALEEDKAMRVKIKATVRSDSGIFGVASFELHGLFHRELGGDVTLSSDIESSVIGADGDGENWALTFGVNTISQEINVIAFGSALGSVQWTLSIEYQKVGLAT